MQNLRNRALGALLLVAANQRRVRNYLDACTTQFRMELRLDPLGAGTATGQDQGEGGDQGDGGDASGGELDGATTGVGTSASHGSGGGGVAKRDDNIGFIAPAGSGCLNESQARMWAYSKNYTSSGLFSWESGNSVNVTLEEANHED